MQGSIACRLRDTRIGRRAKISLLQSSPPRIGYGRQTAKSASLIVTDKLRSLYNNACIPDRPTSPAQKLRKTNLRGCGD
jgi:hypothetical protein